MKNTTKTSNGRKLSTHVKYGEFEVYFSRPVKGVKSERTNLNVTGINPLTGEKTLVQLNGRNVLSLRKLISKKS